MTTTETTSQCVSMTMKVANQTIGIDPMSDVHYALECITRESTCGNPQLMSNEKIMVAKIVHHESNGLSLAEDDFRLIELRDRILESNRSRLRTETDLLPNNKRRQLLPSKQRGRREVDQSGDRSAWHIYQLETFPTSGLLAGQPGYGYDRNGVPLGASYIAYMRDHNDSIVAVRDGSPLRAKDKRISAVQELARGGWNRPERVIGPRNESRRNNSKRFTVANAVTHNKRHEEMILEAVQRFNPEFEL